MVKEHRQKNIDEVNFIKNVDIILVSLSSKNEGGAIWKQIQRNFPSVGILSLAAYVREFGFNPYVIDGTLEGLSVNEICERISEAVKKNEQIKYIGISTTTYTYYESQEIATFCKQHFNNISTLMGGPHATALPEHVLRESQIDIVVRGEGETQLLSLLQNVAIENIKGISYVEKGAIIHNPDSPRLKSIEDLPMPAYDLVPMEKSKPFIGQFVGLKKVVPSTLVLATRGCVGNCTFCSKCFLPGVTYKSPEKLFKEILFLKNTYGFRHIVFYDDTFTSNKKLINEFCDILMANGNPITWTCSSRTDCVDLPMLNKMKKAGCKQILYGVESFNDDVLKSINKITDVENNVNAIKWTKQVGMIVRVAIMIGNPADTKDTIENNIKVLRRLQPDMIQVSITTPIPGSLMFNQGVENGKILIWDWSKYNGDYLVIEHPNLTEKELRKYYIKTYYKFYFHYKYILKKMFSLTTYTQIRVLMSGLLCLIPIFFTKKKHT